MNWDAVGAIGEIVGALAVVATLGYLAVQIRHQVKEAHLSSMEGVASKFGEINGSLVTDPRVAEIWNIATTQGVEGLDETQASQFASLMHMVFRFWENCYFQSQENRLDERLWNSIDKLFSEMLSSKGFGQFWDARKEYYSEDFRRYADQIQRTEFRTLRNAVVENSEGEGNATPAI